MDMVMTDWPPELVDKALRAWTPLGESVTPGIVRGVLDAIADDIVLKSALNRITESQFGRPTRRRYATEWELISDDEPPLSGSIFDLPEPPNRGRSDD